MTNGSLLFCYQSFPPVGISLFLSIIDLFSIFFFLYSLLDISGDLFFFVWCGSSGILAWYSAVLVKSHDLWCRPKILTRPERNTRVNTAAAVGTQVYIVRDTCNIIVYGICNLNRIIQLNDADEFRMNVINKRRKCSTTDLLYWWVDLRPIHTGWILCLTLKVSNGEGWWSRLIEHGKPHLQYRLAFITFTRLVTFHFSLFFFHRISFLVILARTHIAIYWPVW